MKAYRILKDFSGSQTGNDGPHFFTAGTEANLSDHLAEVVLKEGWVELADPSDLLADITGLDGPVPEGDLEHDLANPAELRLTKVDGPEETKPASKKLGKKKAA